MRSVFAWLLGLGIIAGVSAVADPVEQQDANPPVARVESNPVSTSAAPEPAKVGPAAPAPAQAPAPAEEEKPGPLTLKIGSTEINPFGFVDLTGVYRSTNVGSGIGTSFGGIPFTAAGTATGSVPTVAGNLSETKLSPQNSRLGLKATGKIGETKYAGYLEADFLGFQVVNSQVTSNSYTFRLRNYFALVQSHSVDLTAGQAWSLMTPGKKGVSPTRMTSSSAGRWTRTTLRASSGRGRLKSGWASTLTTTLRSRWESRTPSRSSAGRWSFRARSRRPTVPVRQQLDR
jgi:hypothetical protein